MRRDIQHWERALELAAQIAPKELPFIAKEASYKKLEIPKFQNTKILKYQNFKLPKISKYQKFQIFFHIFLFSVRNTTRIYGST